MSGPATIAVVGGGASGCLTAIRVARAAPGRLIEIVIIEPAELGAGLAFSTPDSWHRLNVAARAMSALPEEPEHFLDWLHQQVDAEFPASGFAPRWCYAEYLRQTLASAVDAAGTVSLEQVRARVTDLSPHGRRLRLTLDDGASRAADAVVLAMGHAAPATSWAPEVLRRSARFVADPWRTDRVSRLPAGSEVLLVGAGLTMADMARRWAADGVRLHVVSRHGMLPLPHATVAQPPVGPPSLPTGPVTLAQARHLVFDQLRSRGGDWRPVIDGMRPVTAALWSQLSEDARASFLATAARRWDRVRHRVDPELHSWLTDRVADGSLVTHAAAVAAAHEDESALHVQLDNGTRLAVAAVLNCTGTSTGLGSNADPLMLNLLDRGLAQPGPVGLGLATDAHGRLLPATGRQPAVWTLGPLRRGELWESTAIPEIRRQAADLARELIAALPDSDIRRRPRDRYGLPLTATEGAAEVYTTALGRILRVQSGAEQLIAEALTVDPSFALGHAALALLGAEWGAAVDIDAALAAAQRLAGQADERERHFIEVATARIRQPGADSSAGLLNYIRAYPEDALAVSIAVPTIAFSGATEIPAEAWTLIEGLGAAYGTDWWHRSMLAFVRQEQGRFDEALALANLALAEEPAAGHAAHARAHVHYETGDHRAGLQWLDSWITTWATRTSHRAHFHWHAALHELALGDNNAALARYTSQLAAPEVSGVRALIDSASLLWRGYTAGGWPTTLDIGPTLATVPATLLTEPPTPFLALHAAIAMTAANDCQGLARLRRYARARTEPAFTETIATLAEALAHLVHGDVQEATDLLLELPGVERLGGSAAQREIIEQTLIFSATRADRTELARSIRQARQDRRRLSSGLSG